jgi:hypothetical protein
MIAVGDVRFVSSANKSEQSSADLADEAFRLMEEAQVLLDRAGLTQAAAHLDHALACIPDRSGIFPRKRKNPPPAF